MISLEFYGPSGSGKSTFIKIILGLIEPIKGKILFNENQVNSSELRSLCSYVPQARFNDSR